MSSAKLINMVSGFCFWQQLVTLNVACMLYYILHLQDPVALIIPDISVSNILCTDMSIPCRSLTSSLRTSRLNGTQMRFSGYAKLQSRKCRITCYFFCSFPLYHTSPYPCPLPTFPPPSSSLPSPFPPPPPLPPSLPSFRTRDRGPGTNTTTRNQSVVDLGGGGGGGSEPPSALESKKKYCRLALTI